MIKIGVPQHVSARPLIYGLMRDANRRIQLTYGEPSQLAEGLARGRFDAALIPAIEYLRGAGELHIEGPALVARPEDGNIILVTRRPLEGVSRIAVDEFCRTPVAVLRVVLAERHGITPDFLVEKNLSGWRENYDAVLLSGDATLRYRMGPMPEGDTTHNVAGMWYDLLHVPLVTALWVHSDASHAAEVAKSLITSRNLGLQNLSHLVDGIAQTSEFDSTFLYDYLSGCWSYDMRDRELAGLRALEEYAIRFDLLRYSRLEGAATS